AAEGRIESAGGADLLASDGGVPGPELTEARLPFAAGHGAVLVLEHRLLPGDPRLGVTRQRAERAHHRAARLFGLGAQVLGDELGRGNHVVVEEEDDVAFRRRDARIARRRWPGVQL